MFLGKKIGRGPFAPPPTHGNKLSGGPPREFYGVTAAVWRCGDGDCGAAAVVGRIVPRKSSLGDVDVA